MNYIKADGDLQHCEVHVNKLDDICTYLLDTDGKILLLRTG